MRNKAAYYGLVYGGVSIAINLLFWLLKPELLFDMGIGTLIGFGLPIVMMYLSIKATRDEQEGLISYGEAIRASFLTFMIGSLIAIMFQFILFNFIDDSLLELQKESAIKATESVMSMLGADSEEAMEEVREQMEEQTGQLTFGQSMVGWLFSLFFPGLIISLIISAIMKKNY